MLAIYFISIYFCFPLFSYHVSEVVESHPEFDLPFFEFQVVFCDFPLVLHEDLHSEPFFNLTLILFVKMLLKKI